MAKPNGVVAEMGRKPTGIPVGVHLYDTTRHGAPSLFTPQVRYNLA